MFSTTCSGREAPVMTVLTFGFFRHQAIARTVHVVLQDRAHVPERPG
jgi:hypothetical protein